MIDAETYRLLWLYWLHKDDLSGCSPDGCRCGFVAALREAK